MALAYKMNTYTKMSNDSTLWTWLCMQLLGGPSSVGARTLHVWPPYPTTKQETVVPITAYIRMAPRFLKKCLCNKQHTATSSHTPISLPSPYLQSTCLDSRFISYCHIQPCVWMYQSLYIYPTPCLMCLLLHIQPMSRYTHQLLYIQPNVQMQLKT